MEVRVRERLIGALVLVALVVLLVPSVLKGRDPAPADAPQAGPEQAPRRVVVKVAPGPADPADEEDVLMPEPSDPAQPTAPAAADRPKSAAPPSQASAQPPAESRPAPATGAPDPAQPVAPAWAVQLGAFSTRAKADELVAGLRGRGYAAFVLEYRASGRVLHRVRVGPEQDRARAEDIAARLRKDGFQPVVARHP